MSETIFTALDELVIDSQSGFASGERSPDGSIQVRMNNVSTDGLLNLSDHIRVPALPSQLRKYSLLPNDVLFNSTNSPELVGKSAVFRGHSEPVVYSNHFVRLRTKQKELLPDYLAHWLTWQWQQGLFANLCTQWVNQAAVRKEDLLSLLIPLPPIAEQRRIAAVLAKADRLRRLRRYALEVSAGYVPSVFAAMFGDLIKNTRGWDTSELELLGNIASGVTKGQKYNGRATIEVPYLRVANVQDGFLNLSEVKTIPALPADVEGLRLKVGDIVMTEGGDFDKLGRGAIWNGEIDPCIHQNHIFRVRLDSALMLPEFFAAFLLSDYAKAYFLQASKQTTNLATINMTQLKALPVRVPPLPLQQRFAAIVRRHERLRAQQREALRQAEQLFAALLSRAFRGELGGGEGVEAVVAGGGEGEGRTKQPMEQMRLGL